MFLDIVAPTRKEAVQINFVLWFTVMCVMTLGAILSGQVQSVPEALSMFGGTITALAASLLLIPLVRRVAGRAMILAIPIGIAGLTCTAMLQTLGDYAQQFLVHRLLGQHRMPDYSRQSLFLVTTIYWSLSACNMALLSIAGAARRIRRREVELARSQLSVLKAELKQLQLQLNPHFLGNALNGISALILEQRYAEANRMTEHLADFMHAVMRADSPDRTLRDEIAILRRYLNMEALRFGDRLKIAIALGSGTERVRVPSLILQPLVENAIHHGVERSQGQACLAIRATRGWRELVLEVENHSGAPVGEGEPRAGHGIGLSNTRARLQLLFGHEASLVEQPLDNGYRVTIRLPLEDVR